MEKRNYRRKKKLRVQERNERRVRIDKSAEEKKRKRKDEKKNMKKGKRKNKINVQKEMYDTERKEKGNKCKRL